MNVDIPIKSGACIKIRIDPELSRRTISAVTSNNSSASWVWYSDIWFYLGGKPPFSLHYSHRCWTFNFLWTVNRLYVSSHVLVVHLTNERVIYVSTMKVTLYRTRQLPFRKKGYKETRLHISTIEHAWQKRILHILMIVIIPRYFPTWDVRV